ncbi:hypothetical protein GCM10028791_44020 [Echinicola sediminis]
MKQVLYLSFTALLILSACTKEKTEIPTGTFYGVLPCADCPGISYELELGDDSSFTEKMVYQEKSEKVLEKSGVFSVSEEGLIELEKDENEGLRLLKVTSDSLQLLDIEGKAVEGGTAGLHYLKKDKPDNFNMKLREPSSIGFKATGNEPFWSLEIDFNKQMTFKPMEGEALVTPVPEPIRPQDVNAVSYRAATEKGTLHVTIFKRKCQDSMADQEFGHEVKVSLKMGGEDELMSYSGCGDYQGDYRLNDIWALETINGESLISKGKAPNLEFNLMENRFYGFGGCNRIQGQLTIDKQEVTFGKVISTMMACPNLEKEASFIKKLNEQRYSFKIEGTKLTLSNATDRLIFKKID